MDPAFVREVPGQLYCRNGLSGAVGNVESRCGPELVPQARAADL